MKNEIAIRPLHVLQLRDPEAVWTRAARKLNHKPPKLFRRSDVVVLRPDIPAVFQARNEPDMFILAAFGVVMSDMYHICLLSLVGDKEIEGITNAKYTSEQIEEAMTLGLIKTPHLPDAQRLYGGAQLSQALLKNEERRIPLTQK